MSDAIEAVRSARIITTSIRDLFAGCWQPVTATESPN